MFGSARVTISPTLSFIQQCLISHPQSSQQMHTQYIEDDLAVEMGNCWHRQHYQPRPSCHSCITSAGNMAQNFGRERERFYVVHSIGWKASDLNAGHWASTRRGFFEERGLCCCREDDGTNPVILLSSFTCDIRIDRKDWLWESGAELVLSEDVLDGEETPEERSKRWKTGTHYLNRLVNRGPSYRNNTGISRIIKDCWLETDAAENWDDADTGTK